MRSRGVALIVCCWLAVLAGCGGDPLGRKALSGTVSLDGVPVEAGNVSFQPVGTSTVGSGATIAGGKYSLTQKNGLPPGKYRVTINAPKPGTGGKVAEGAMPGDPVAPPQELIPAEWNTNSEEHIEVKNSGPNEFDFAIKSKGK